MSEPLVTIAIACRDDEARIESVVHSAQNQLFPRESLQIVVADGMSMDSTREALSRMAAGDDRIELADNPRRGRAAGLNECIRKARGDVIVRFDPGAEYPPDFVRRCVTALGRTGADSVEGSARPNGRSFLQRCAAAAIRSPLGVGRREREGGPDEGWADGVRPAAYRRDVFERAGLFDPRAVADEEAELRKRMTAVGCRVERVQALDAPFVFADSMAMLFRRAFFYGRGRARTMLKHGSFASWGPAMPLLWLVGEGILAVASPRRAFPLSLAAYALATGAEAVRIGVREGAMAAPVVWAIFPALHVAHAAGYAAGLAKYALHPDWHQTDEDQTLAPSAAGPYAARDATA